MAVFAGSVMVLAAVFAVTRFDQPALWVPLLGLSQHPFWHGVHSLRVHHERSRSSELESGDRTR